MKPKWIRIGTTTWEMEYFEAKAKIRKADGGYECSLNVMGYGEKSCGKYASLERAKKEVCWFAYNQAARMHALCVLWIVGWRNLSQGLSALRLK